MGGRAERWLRRNPPEARAQAVLRGWVGEGEMKAGRVRGKRPVGDEVKALFTLPPLLGLKAEIILSATTAVCSAQCKLAFA